jgi:hypothetical protein
MRLKCILALIMTTGGVMLAGDNLGKVSAAKGLEMNGQAVPVAGTKEWPVGAGDELRSDAAPVVLTMRDGSRFVLGAKSQAKVETGVVRLVNGTMRYELAQRSDLRVAVKSDVLAGRTGVASTVANPVTPVAAPRAAAEETLPISRRRP